MTDTKPAAPVVDCRTCTHYLQGMHGCQLFCNQGQRCINGDRWQFANFAPLWKVK